LTVQLEISHHDARALFGALIDEELAPDEKAQVSTHLARCDDCRAGYVKYERVVQQVRSLERLRAPPTLATRILLRVRRRRPFGTKGLALLHAQHRVPVEVIIPVLLAAAVAALLLFLGR
jgi:anti-sigma factor RsiW